MRDKKLYIYDVIYDDTSVDLCVCSSSVEQSGERTKQVVRLMYGLFFFLGQAWDQPQEKVLCCSPKLRSWTHLVESNKKRYYMHILCKIFIVQ